MKRVGNLFQIRMKQSKREEILDFMMETEGIDRCDQISAADVSLFFVNMFDYYKRHYASVHGLEDAGAFRRRLRVAMAEMGVRLLGEMEE